MTFLAMVIDFVVVNPWRSAFLGLLLASATAGFFQNSKIKSLNSEVETLNTTVSAQKTRIDGQSVIISAQAAGIKSLEEYSKTMAARSKQASASNTKTKKQLAAQLKEIAQLKISNECQPALNILKSEAVGVADDF